MPIKIIKIPQYKTLNVKIAQEHSNKLNSKPLTKNQYPQNISYFYFDSDDSSSSSQDTCSIKSRNSIYTEVHYSQTKEFLSYFTDTDTDTDTEGKTLKEKLETENKHRASTLNIPHSEIIAILSNSNNKINKHKKSQDLKKHTLSICNKICNFFHKIPSLTKKLYKH